MALDIGDSDGLSTKLLFFPGVYKVKNLLKRRFTHTVVSHLVRTNNHAPVIHCANFSITIDSAHELVPAF